MYPSLRDPSLQELLVRRPEFAETHTPIPNVTTLEELQRMRMKLCGSTQFRLSQQQIFLQRFLSPYTPYKTAIFYHGTGVGKTCSSIQVAESFLAQPQNEGKKVIVISSAAVQANFHGQVFSLANVTVDPKTGDYTSRQCTGNTYIHRIERRQRSSFNLMNPADKARLGKEVDRLIAQNYELKGYLAFSNDVLAAQERMKEAVFREHVQRTYSNRLLIVDEAHNIRPSQNSDNKRVAQALRYVTKYAQNLTLVFMTATPMYNDFGEMLWLLNLCIWNDKRTDLFKTRAAYEAGFTVNQFFGANGTFLNEAAEAKFRSLVRSYVSFVRGDNPLVFPFRLDPPQALLADCRALPKKDVYGLPINPDSRVTELKLVVSPMAAAHEETYGRYLKKYSKDLVSTVQQDINLDELDEDRLPVTPDLSTTEDAPVAIMKLFEVGNVGFPKDMNLTTTLSFRKSPDVPGKVIVKYLPSAPRMFARDNLAKYAPKLKTILDCIEGSDGVVFIYSNFVRYGCIPMAMALEEAGYHPYGDPAGFLTDVPAASKTKGSYLLLTGSSLLTPQNIDTEASKNIAGHPSNKDGSRVKIIIGSKRIGEGVDFKFIRQVHIIEPWFNLAQIDQVIGRAIRTCSHALLPFEEQNATVYLHALGFPDGSRETLDMTAYRLAELKSKRIANISKVLQESAFDCFVQYGLNHRDPALLDMKIQQKRSQDHEELTLAVKDLAGPLFVSHDAVTCESDKTEADMPPVDKKDFVPSEFFRDREVEILDRLRELFFQQAVWKWDDLKEDSVLGKYNKKSLRSILTAAVTFPSQYVFTDSQGRKGYLDALNEAYGFRPKSLRDVTLPTEFERSHPIPISNVSIEAAPLPSTKRKLVASDMKDSDILESFRKHLAEQDAQLPADMKGAGYETPAIQQAFDQWSAAFRYRLLLALCKRPALDTGLHAALVIPRTVTLNVRVDRKDVATTAVLALTESNDVRFLLVSSGSSGENTVDENETPLGGVAAAMEEFTNGFRTAYIATPAEVLVGFTEYNREGMRFEHKVILQKTDIRGRVCSTIPKASLDQLVTKIGIPAGASAAANKKTICKFMDLQLRANASADKKVKYLLPEFRALVASLKKKELL